MYKRQYLYLLGSVLLLAYTSLSSNHGQVMISSKDSLMVKKDSTEGKKVEEKKAEKKAESKYERLFKDKRVETVRGGLITLHKTDGKVYFEFPRKHLGERMLLGATISSVTDPSYLAVGTKNATPLHLQFELQDSMIVAKSPNAIVYKTELKEQGLEEALKLNYRDPVSMGFKIEAYSPDSTAIVFDATSLVGRPNNMLPVFPERSGHFTIKSTPRSELSFVKEMKSFPDNVSIKTELSYNYSTILMGMVPVTSDMPTTLDVTFSLMLLPKDKMKPRLADSRVGIFSSNKILFATDQDYSRTVHLAHRWRLEPRDAVAYAAGKKSEPKRPIVYYLDPTFPESWKEPIRRGVLMWNKAFERIGYLNAIQIRNYPTNDAEFDPDNLRYSCIRYVPNAEENANGPSWVDPSSGEIINASIIIYNNIERLLYKWRFVQTAAVDASVRADRLPKDKLAEALSYAVAHEVGHTLGFKHNMAASSAYDTESLRSSEFTRKQGVSASIMDYARFNYVAQPSDKGVNLYQSVLGPYDYYLVEWNYKYYGAKSVEEESKALEALVDAKAGHPWYRYGAEQTRVYDPTVLSDDLGNDAISSSNYGIKNLNYIQANLPRWIKQDPDSRKKHSLSLAIARQYHAYLKNVMHLVGGVVYNDSKESSNIPRYKAISKERQREAFLWAMQTVRNFADFAPREQERQGFISVSFYDQLLEFIAMDVYALYARVALAEHLVGERTYTQREFFDDLYQEVFRSTLAGKPLNRMEMILEKTFVERIRLSVTDPSKSMPDLPVALHNDASLTDTYLTLMELPISLTSEQQRQLMSKAFGDPNRAPYPTIKLNALNQSGLYYFEALSKLQPLLKERIASCKDVAQKAHYQLMSYRIEQLLKHGE